MKPESIETTMQRLFGAPVVEAPPISDICLGVDQFVYTPLFWRPYLGVMAFDLWDVCRVVQKGKLVIERPTIEHLALMLGVQRATILGREGSGNHPRQDGALAVLLREKIAWHTKTGKGRQTEHRIAVRLFLPILTPKQATKFPTRLGDYHELFLGAVRGFDLPAWRKRMEATFVA